MQRIDSAWNWSRAACGAPSGRSPSGSPRSTWRRSARPPSPGRTGRAGAPRRPCSRSPRSGRRCSQRRPGAPRSRRAGAGPAGLPSLSPYAQPASYRAAPKPSSGNWPAPSAFFSPGRLFPRYWTERKQGSGREKQIVWRLPFVTGIRSCHRATGTAAPMDRAEHGISNMHAGYLDPCRIPPEKGRPRRRVIRR